ncbi:SKI family transcriptional corepressor 1 homolog-B-like [Lineus longissimus]|uniref:SKI family transcriptional corepressor 1 homolog-B-like n=1 Tax=Lineus longissimus TaxID=88925 RepID=UPI002B4F8E10
MTTKSVLLSGSPPTSPKGTADSPNRESIQLPFLTVFPQHTKMESPQLSPNIKQNQVGTVLLRAVPIVSLFIDGQERLCLAQISNTLLRDFSYNEIHNRRVALGITCIQCTPVQLEILRRAGAMPVSSRRCGMITKREAERLVKSFLEDTVPPQLPENFCFDVNHECGWGCRGSFMPSRYNSSRAKCIKCYYCSNFFSPNKFIFHCHKMPAGIYRHPDAANFNSWRRHLKLSDKEASDDLEHAWEDVKAMFNGGSRKRLMSSPGQSPVADINDNSIEIKRPRMDVPQFPRQQPQPYPYPMFAAVGTNPYRLFGNILPRPSHPAFPFMQMDQTALPPERKVNQEMMHAKAVQNPYSFLWGKGLDNMAVDSEKMYVSKINDELIRERNFEAMRNNLWHPQYSTKEESPSPPAVNSTANPGQSGVSIYSSAFTPVKRDIDLERKNRKSKPRKGMKIGAIADSILQRNMLASANQPNSDDDNVDIDVSDDEIGSARDYFHQDLFTKAKKAEIAEDFELNNEKGKIADFENDFETIDDVKHKDMGTGLINSDFVIMGSSKHDEIAERVVKGPGAQLGVDCHLQPGELIGDGGKDGLVSTEDTSRRSSEIPVKKVPSTVEIEANDNNLVGEDVRDGEHRQKDGLVHEMSQLHQLRQRAEREYKAIEAVLASGETEHSQQDLQRRLSDAHDALLQFSRKIMSLTCGLEEAKSK